MALMKNLLLSLTILTLALSLNSCTIVGAGIDYSINNSYDTHSDRMGQYTTKSKVISSFGIPNQKDTYEGLDIWKYDLGGYTNSAASAVPIGNGVYGSSSSTYSNRYVEFQFLGEDVINWRTKGVDYGQEKKWIGMWTGFLIDCGLLGAALGTI
jgi:hypothetical protein